MIDGVKLVCNLSPSDWTNNKNLSFRSWTDISTGEITNNNRHANINGLHLSIIEGKTTTFCNVRGSLPLYFTGGETNAIDYDFRDFITTTELLHENLSISAEKAVLRGFEFGVNINLPFDTAEVYECIKSYKMHSFGQYEENGKRLGIFFDLQQYKIKIYDKQMQVTGKKSRLMRFEISVKKMNWVKDLGIKTLADLQNKMIWKELQTILLNVWNEIIFIDKSLKYKNMKSHHQKKYLRFLDVSYWCSHNKNTYHKAKNDLIKFQSLYEGRENTKQLISNLITEKCLKLATEEPEKTGDYLTSIESKKNALENSKILQHLKNRKRRLFNHLNKGIAGGSNSPLTHTDIAPLNNTLNNDTVLTPKNNISKHTINNTRKNIIVKKKCMNCKKALKEKKPTAKFCSLKCKNQHNGKLRTQTSQRKRTTEAQNLDRIIKVLPKTDISLLIIYRNSDGMIYADHLQQSEITASSEWIKQIGKVVIEKPQPIEFTTIRARKLIREIVRQNDRENCSLPEKIG